MLRQFEEADDATQDTFLKAYRSLKQFRGDARLKTWLCRIARNECLNRLRHENMASLDQQLTTDYSFQIADSTPSPLELIEQQETQSIVHEAINKLPHSVSVGYHALPPQRTFLRRDLAGDGNSDGNSENPYLSRKRTSKIEVASLCRRKNMNHGL